MDVARIEQAEQRVEENREKARTRCWKIQATNAFAYYQFAMLHFLQEVQRSQLVVSTEVATALEKADVTNLQTLMEHMLSRFYHGGQREAKPGDGNFLKDLKDDKDTAAAFKTDARPRHVPEDYRLFQACENGGEEDCKINLFNHRKAADVTFTETWRSADVLINIIEKAKVTARQEYGHDLEEWENYIKHLKDVKNAMFYIQKTRREMLREYENDTFGSGIGEDDDSQMKDAEATIWVLQHELFWKRIGWGEHGETFSERQTEMRDFIREKIHKQQQKEFSAFDDNSQSRDDIEDDMIVLKTPNLSGDPNKFRGDERPQMTQYFCTQRFMLFWVKKIRNSIEQHKDMLGMTQLNLLRPSRGQIHGDASFQNCTVFVITTAGISISLGLNLHKRILLNCSLV